MKSSQGTVFIAADSKRTFPKGGPQPQTICKIHKSGKCYFAVAGHDDSTMTIIIRQTLNSNLPIPRLIELCISKLKLRYKQIMNDPTHISPEELDYFLHNALAHVAFIYFENKSAIIDEMAITMTRTNGVLHFKDTVAKNVSPCFLGIYDHLGYHTPEIQTIFQKYNGDPVKLMTAMIKLEIKNHPENIGEPIDVVELRPEGEPIWHTPKRHDVKYPFSF